MRKIFFVLLALPAGLFAQGYQYTADLVNVVDDKVKVTLVAKPFESDSAVFFFPRMVPGTYSVYDFGRFISGFQAFDDAGNPLTVVHPDSNTWKIKGAKKFAKLSYWVEDTWDWFGQGPRVFEPGGSNIEEGKNFFVNNHCFFGYFEGRKNETFEVTFQKPQGFFGATALQAMNRLEEKEIFRANGYFELCDSPVMFCPPDTATVNVGGGNILFAVYSPDSEITAAQVAAEVEPVLRAQASYLGGKLPVDRYAFIFYFFDGFSMSFSYGALEHNFCSMYYVPEGDLESSSEMLHDFCAHEFFHIVTPLSIHSEQVHDFDFMNPVMSRHLWLYEGVTEYSAGHVQVKEELIGLQDYFEIIREKIASAAGYNDTVPFTVMSQGALDKYKDEYGNVYSKGALIGMCLDVLLRTYSSGEYGIQNLMRDLSEEYGKEKPFVDAELFSKIESLTYPQIGEFLRRYVAGPEPLPLTEILGYAGVEFLPEKKLQKITTGGAEFSINGEGKVYVFSTWDLDGFGRDIGYQAGDILVSLNGVLIEESNAKEVFVNYFKTHAEGDPFILVVNRPLKKKKFKTLELKAEYTKMLVKIENYIGLKEGITEAQKSILKAWLGENILKEE